MHVCMSLYPLWSFAWQLYLVECTSPRALGAEPNGPSTGVTICAIVSAFQSLGHSICEACSTSCYC